MQVTFIGVGEAFDELLPNTSMLVETASTSLLLDCGFSAPFSYWRMASNPLELDGLFLSHFHGDHFFGLPALLLRMFEEGRTKPLHIFGGRDVEERVCAAMDLAYSSTRARFAFALEFAELIPGQDLEWKELRMQSALSEHSRPNLSLRISHAGKALMYSGDGRPTPATRTLARDVDLMVHESFSLVPDVPGHGTVPGSIAMAREAGAARLALVHIRRDVRHGLRQQILELAQAEKDLEVLLPDPGEMLTL